MSRNNCETCRHFTVTGREDFYDTGTCGHPTPIVAWLTNRPEWTNCLQWQRRRKSDKAKAPEPQPAPEPSTPTNEALPPPPEQSAAWRRRKAIAQEMVYEIVRRRGL